MNILVSLMVFLAETQPDTLVVPLKEVVVTGTRTPESALRAPAAISVVNRNRFIDGRGIGINDALSLVPGVLAQSRGGAQDVRVTIRGFGARGNGERSNAGSIRGIRVLTDGIPVTEPDGRTSLDVVDLGSADRVEVVRSNSSTLYGNASGGVLHLRTNMSFDQPYLEVLERAGSFGFHREQATLGLVIGSARGVFTLFNSTFEGWRQHSMSTATMLQTRLSLPLDERTRLGFLLDGVSDLNRFPGALTQAELDSAPQQANPEYVTRDERRRNRVGRVGLSMDRGLTAQQDLSVNLYVEPKVLQRSERNRFRDFNRYHLGTSVTWQLRERLANGLEGRTLVGADEAFQDGAILFYNVVNGSRGTNLIANQREAANGAGAFLQQDFSWSRWSLRLAGRYDQLWYLSEDHTDPRFDARKTFDRFTPKGSVSYAFDRHTLFAALGGGVEGPAFNEIDPPPPFDTLTSLNPFLEAMHSTTYELGAKGMWSNGSPWGGLRYDAALYWIEVMNELVPIDGGTFFRTAGKSRRRGLELGLDWLALERLGLEGAVTLSSNEYLEYLGDPEGDGVDEDLGGRKAPGLPDLVAAGAIRLLLPQGLTARLSVDHSSDYFADDANQARVPGHTVLGATLAYERSWRTSTLRAFVSGDNLTDEEHVASVFINGVRSDPTDPSTGRYFEPGLPRNWSAGLTLRYR